MGGRCGTAVWFADSGGLTASGERSAPGALTAAHRSLPFGSEVKVENLANGRSVVVRVNDRGPKNRIISVSSAAADELGMKKKGVARVRLTLLGEDNPADDACGAVASHAEAGGDLPSEGDIDPGSELELAPAAEAVTDTDVMRAVVPGSMSERFALAFAPEPWQATELRRVMEAVAPRVFSAAPPNPPLEGGSKLRSSFGEGSDARSASPAPKPAKALLEAAKASPLPSPVEPPPGDIVFSQRLAEHWPILQGQAGMDLSPAALSGR